MADKKPKLPEFLTVKCLSSYPKLLVPDTFKGKTFFAVKLIMSLEDANAIRKNAAQQMASFYEYDLERAAEEANTPKAKAALEHRRREADSGNFSMSIEDQLEGDGKPTGKVMVTFKQNATIEFTDKTSKEKVKRDIRIPIFDARGNPIQTHDDKGRLLPNAIRIYSGTEMKVRYQIIGAWIESSKVYWASLRPVAVQIINLVSSPAVKSAGEYGFGAEEGYVAGSDEGTGGPTEGGSGADSY